MTVADLLFHFLVSLSAVFFVVDPLGVVPIFLEALMMVWKLRFTV